MSKTKIVEEHEIALATLQNLGLPPESGPLLKRLDRAFKELRGLHTEAERDRKDWSKRVAQLEEAMKDAAREGGKARAEIESLEKQVDCLASNLVSRLTGRESKPRLAAEMNNLQHKLESLAAECLASHPDLASRLLPPVQNLVETMTGHVEKMCRIYEQDIATYEYILCLVCHQKGPLQLIEPPPGAVEIYDLELHREHGGWSIRVKGA